MPTNVRVLVETEPHAPVRLVGVLAPPTAGVIRETLLTALADRPSPVVVDVSGLSVRDPQTLAVFDEVSQETAEWPVGELLVTPVDAGTVGRRAAETSARSLSARLDPAVGAARRARGLVTEGCARWDVPDLIGPGCIAATELVNNVVVHAHTPMTLQLAYRGDALHLSVRDYSPEPPVFTGSAPTTSAGGRGLLLVDSVARRWGVTPLTDGKLIWAVLYAEDEPGR
ncbi:ATP-binding protein [Plantactinospora sp. GCM10030261]|uniref:ATP-binding protein n=1 Tax=Plantactinospora sp. GCM10030261 TaxID=3273420 RepID=UPI00361A2E74